MRDFLLPELCPSCVPPQAPRNHQCRQRKERLIGRGAEFVDAIRDQRRDDNEVPSIAQRTPELKSEMLRA
jgi:hypothetical protein